MPKSQRPPGRPSRSTEMLTAAKLEIEEHRPRKCLMCGNQFVSEGAHNRVCKKCKGTNAWRFGEPPAHF